ncbi:LysM domain/BON superfamily protein [Planctomycetes bacterium Poly30]|uniref:LysM domain/BON superfamily protein n=1 Tax=Saltatorellus ferox TaxID=2528018 RepID=A0A518EVU2_9BACT|nr:LysM domain/BON superfamily protein [Planctomycetes bacterium Poly30]
MQPYERIGLVAVLFLVVILAVGALWDDGSSDDALLAAERAEIERVDEEAAAREAAAAAQKAERIRLAQETARGASRQRPGAAGEMPMGGVDEVESGVSRVTTLSNGSDHRSAPLDLSAPRVDRDDYEGARAQTPDELKGFARPSRGGAREAAEGAVSMSARSPRRGQGSESERPREEPRPEQPREQALVAEVRTPAPTAGARPRTYTVQPGDALQRIAQRELGDSGQASTIASLNGLSDPNMIQAGMVLILPGTAVNGASASSGSAVAAIASSSGGASSAAAAPAGAGRPYTIRSGESLSTALVRELGTYKRSISLVKALNPGLNPDRVLAGQVIYLPRAESIPGGATSPAPSSASRRGSGAPALDTSPGTSTVAAAERASAPASTSRSARSNSEFVVR